MSTTAVARNNEVCPKQWVMKGLSETNQKKLQLLNAQFAGKTETERDK